LRIYREIAAQKLCICRVFTANLTCIYRYLPRIYHEVDTYLPQVGQVFGACLLGRCRLFAANLRHVFWIITSHIAENLPRVCSLFTASLLQLCREFAATLPLLCYEIATFFLDICCMQICRVFASNDLARVIVQSCNRVHGELTVNDRVKWIIFMAI
jgi:hypothetical protein